jgi:hypothetical protein
MDVASPPIELYEMSLRNRILHSLQNETQRNVFTWGDETPRYEVILTQATVSIHR